MAAVIAENFVMQQGEDFFKDFVLTNPDKSYLSIFSGVKIIILFNLYKSIFRLTR